MVSFIRVIHSIICCRILLNLKRATSLPMMTSVEAPIDGLAFAVSPGLQLRESVTVPFEASNVEGCEEGDRNSDKGPVN